MNLLSDKNKIDYFWQLYGKNVAGVATLHTNTKSNYVYCAIRGTVFNGEDFINSAIALGAKYILLSIDGMENYPTRLECIDLQYIHKDVIYICNDIIYIYVNNIRMATSYIAYLCYPRQLQHQVAVTGTNGKTSTTHFFAQLCSMFGNKSAAIGTLGIFKYNPCGEQFVVEHDISDSQKRPLTTLDAVTLHQSLSQLTHDGYTHLAIEASSHGLHQYRMHNMNLRAAAITNIGQDHIDYHITHQLYVASKLRIFDEILRNSKETDRMCIINADMQEYEAIANGYACHNMNILTYGISESANVRILDHNYADQSLKLLVFGKKYNIPWTMAGDFQVYNAVCALCLMIGSGFNECEVIDRLSYLKPILGRMERVAIYNGAEIFIDYAHTPDGLEIALKSLKKIIHSRNNNGKLHVVFGCGGNRDAVKRPQMGAIAQNIANYITVTNDNPRNECPEMIRKEIMIGCPNANNIACRESAIINAMLSLNPGDILLIAGKGHETKQLIGADIIEFSERNIIMEMLAKQ